MMNTIKSSVLQFAFAVVVMLSCVNTASAVSLLSDRLHAYGFITIPYVSVDTENKPVLLSASVCYPTVSEDDSTPAEVKFIVLNNHPTITMNDQAPTQSSPLDAFPVYAPHGAMTLMVAEYAMVISCDYLGYGYSRDRVHPYCNHMLSARNVLDGYVAAMDTIKARGIKLADDYYTLNGGYSQGGAVSMAVQKYLETVGSEDLNNLVRLKHSYCGAGPYDLPLTYKDLAAGETLAYSCSLPMTVQGLCQAYKEGCMKQLDPDSLYTSHDFRVGIEKVINDKNMKSEDICQWIVDYFGKGTVSASDFLRPEVLNHTSYAAKMLDKALGMNNLLDGTWMPKTPITMYQFTGDQVVPYSNSLKAVEVFGDKVKLYNENSGLECNDKFLQSMLVNIIQPKPKAHTDYGTYFAVYFLDGVLREK